MKAAQAGHDSEGPVALVDLKKASTTQHPLTALSQWLPLVWVPWVQPRSNCGSFLGSSCLPLSWALRGTLMQGPVVTLARVILLVPAWPASLLISRNGHFLSSQTLVLTFPSQGLARPPGQLAAKPCSFIRSVFIVCYVSGALLGPQNPSVKRKHTHTTPAVMGLLLEVTV